MALVRRVFEVYPGLELIVAVLSKELYGVKPEELGPVELSDILRRIYGDSADIIMMVAGVPSYDDELRLY